MTIIYRYFLCYYPLLLLLCLNTDMFTGGGERRIQVNLLSLRIKKSIENIIIHLSFYINTFYAVVDTQQQTHYSNFV